MKKFVTIKILLLIVFVAHAAQDSTRVAVENIKTRNSEKKAADSTKVAKKVTSQDTDTSKTKAAKTLFKPDSLQKFVDKNGDGFNDNAPDHDGDGIPDALDKDYWAWKDKNKPKPEDGAPPKVYGLDNRSVKIVQGNKSKQVKKKPGIKFNRPKPKRHRGRR